MANWKVATLKIEYIGLRPGTKLHVVESGNNMILWFGKAGHRVPQTKANEILNIEGELNDEESAKIDRASAKGM